MRKIITLLLSIIIIMVVIPAIAVFTVRSDMGMAVMIILLFTVNPLFSIFLGMFCGADLKKMWYMPLLSALTFLVSSWIIFGFDIDFSIYAAVYLIAGYFSAFLRRYINKLINLYYNKEGDL